MRLVVNGDSFTFGEGLAHDENIGWTYSIDDYNYAMEHNWPANLSYELDASCVNLSLPGGSNDRIVRTTIEHLLINGYRDTLVVIGWTEPSRREIHCIDHPLSGMHTISKRIEGNSRWHRLCINGHDLEDIPGGEEWYANNLILGWDMVESMIRFSQQVLLLSSWFKQHNIPYLFFNSIYGPRAWYDELDFNTYEKDSIRPFFENIDWTDWATHNDTSDSFASGICWQHNELLPCLHPTSRGHHLISNAIKVSLTEKGLIK